MKKKIEVLVHYDYDSKFHEVVSFDRNYIASYGEKNAKWIEVEMSEATFEKIKYHIENIGTAAVSEAGAVRYY